MTAIFKAPELALIFTCLIEDKKARKPLSFKINTKLISIGELEHELTFYFLLAFVMEFDWMNAPHRTALPVDM